MKDNELKSSWSLFFLYFSDFVKINLNVIYTHSVK